MNRHGIKTLVALLNALIISLLVFPANAQETESAGIEMSAQAGFDGFYKSEFWVPVQITIANSGPSVDGHVQIIVTDSFSDDEVVYRSPLSLPTQSRKQTTLYVYLPDLSRNLTVQFVDDVGQIVQVVETNRLEWLGLDDLLYVVASSQPGKFGFLEEIPGNHDSASVAYTEIEDLPEIAAAWNTADILIIHDVDSERLTTSQLESLEGWVSTGGRLVVAGGPRWQRSTNSLDPILPVTITGLETMPDLPELRTGSVESFRDPGPYLVTTSRMQNGEILIDEGDLPLLAKRDLGRGAVYFLALDPTLAPLADWDGGEMFWQEIVSATTPLPPWATGAKNGFAASNAISSLPSLALPSAAGLLLFLLLYIILVGPLNYLVLSRLNLRELAWLTIPGLVVIFSVLAYLAGFRLKGNEALVNQMSIAFGHIEGDLMRVQTLIGLYSPRRSSYELTMPGDVAVRPFDSAYGSLSGGSIGAVERSRYVKVTGVRVDVGGIQPLVIDSYRPIPDLNGQVLIRPGESDLVLDITVENQGRTTLETASLLIGQSVISLGDLKPGDVVSITESLSSTFGSSSITSIGSGMVPPAPGSPSLMANYETILGTADYFTNQEIYPRWQLLEAITPEFSSAPGAYSAETATLIAWSNQEQIDIILDNPSFDGMATTLYFLELPMFQAFGDEQEFTLPVSLLDWQVLGENGVFTPSINDFYFPPGWIEFEYIPWPEFQALSIDELKIVLRQQTGIESQPLPIIRLWDWRQKIWIELDDTDWGGTPIEDLDSFLGAGNALRLRLENNTAQGISILEVYPEITGRFDRP